MCGQTCGWRGTIHLSDTSRERGSPNGCQTPAPTTVCWNSSSFCIYLAVSTRLGGEDYTRVLVLTVISSLARSVAYTVAGSVIAFDFASKTAVDFSARCCLDSGSCGRTPRKYEVRIALATVDFGVTMEWRSESARKSQRAVVGTGDGLLLCGRTTRW